MSAFHHLVKEQPPQVQTLDLGENTACVLLKKRSIVVRDTPMPVLQPDGVLVRVIASGICGSDLHNYTAGGVGGRPVTEPLVMGHESAGEVIAVGNMVKTHKVGDRVAGEYSATQAEMATTHPQSTARPIPPPVTLAFPTFPTDHCLLALQSNSNEECSEEQC